MARAVVVPAVVFVRHVWAYVREGQASSGRLGSGFGEHAAWATSYGGFKSIKTNMAERAGLHSAATTAMLDVQRC